MQHKFLTLAAAVAAAWVFGLPALAAGGAGVYGTVQGEDAVLYLRSGSADAAYTCMVGNTPVTPAKATPLSGLDTPARTVILLDNSAAISESQRDTIHDILNGLAGTRLNGETFTLDTLGAEVTPLCDGETDYLQLKTVVDSLTYNDHTAQLTDCVYRVLDSLVQQNSPALTRVVLITTGAEEEQYGYTRQELADLIRKAGFPLYIIGADDGTDAARAQLQELFALARLTDGDTYALSETQDVAAIVNGIRAWDRGVRVDVPLPAALCDGSDRAMQLSDGGANTVTLTLTMPFAAADNTTSDVGRDAPIPPQGTADIVPTAEPEPLVQPTAPDEDKPSVLPFALGGAGLLAALAAAFMALRRKKPAPAAPLPVQPTASDAPATMMAEATMFGGTAAIFGGDAAPLTVTLTDLADPAHTVTFPLDGTVSLGRDPGLCRIVLDYDPSISRHQCDLCLRGGDVVLVNQSSSNGTKVNGEKITTEYPLTDGSIIKMGNVQLRLTIT